MTKQHPITPSPSLVQQWMDLPLSEEECLVVAAQWGADQELEACREWAEGYAKCGDQLRAARRAQIKPSLKKQALKTLFRNHHNIEYEDYTTILLALESMPENLIEDSDS